MNKSRSGAFILLGLLAASGASNADVVTEWNEAALDAVRTLKDNPPHATRALAITHIAIYDTANGMASTHQPYLVASEPPQGASLEAAIAAAAYTTLIAVYSNPEVQSTHFTALYEAQLETIPDGASKADGIVWGQSVAEAVLAWRASDGWTNLVNYTPKDQPGYWEPTPPMFAPPLLPHWGNVRPFSMASGSQFRPQAPPPIESAAYSFEYNVVKDFGGTESTMRTENQTEVAFFWNDEPGTFTPPGHWNAIAQEVSESQGLTVLENARLFALLNIGLADAAISSWEAKYYYDYWRPVTAIREADTDGNPETEKDEQWSALIFMPPFPEYTSGHSTFSRCAATVLAGFFGADDIPFSTTTDGLPGVIRTYPGFSAAADEAGISRIYGGIHWPSANYQGQSCGFQIGSQVVRFMLRPMNALRFSRVRASGHDMELEIQGEPSRSYRIHASSDLNSWETIATLSSEDGILRFHDVNAANAGLRFYKAEAE